jgi:hypothetical protein
MEGPILDNPPDLARGTRADAVVSATRDRGLRLRVFRGHGQLAAEWAHRRLARRAPGRSRSRGQSLVEFALILPILLLLTLIAVDFGRVYLGWINLQNMTRIAANFAADNAANMDKGDAATVAKYRNQINSDASASNCPLAPGQPAKPTYQDVDSDPGIGLGDRASVTLVCRFHVITPLISFIVGSNLNVTASAVFPVKQAIVETSTGGGGGGGCLLPSPAINATPAKSGPSPLTVNFRDASGGGAGVTWKWTFTGPESHPDVQTQDALGIQFVATGTYNVDLEVSNACGTVKTASPTVITVGPANPPPAGCLVPSLNGIKFNNAQPVWGTPKPPGAGFTTTVLRDTGAPNGNFTISAQDLTAGTGNPIPCNSVIHVK